MRKEFISNTNGEDYYSFVYYNSYDKKRIRLSREYIQQRFGKDIVDPDEADDIITILEKELKTLSTEKEKRFNLREDDYEFHNLLAMYTEWQSKAAPNSYENNLHYLKYYVLHFFLRVKGCKNLDGWGMYYDDFKEWLEHGAFLIRNPSQLISFGSKNHCIRALNTFMRHMHRKRYVANFVSCPKFPRYLMKERTLDDVVPPKEMERIYYELRTGGSYQEAAFYRLLYFTGMRFNEACGLSLADIYQGKIDDQTLDASLSKHDISYHGYLVIDSQPANRRMPRNADGKVPRKPLKGKKKIDEKSGRVVPVIDEQLWKDIASFYNEQLALFEKEIWGKNEKDYLLFPGVNSTSSTILQSVCSKLHVPYRSWHCLRHTRATLLVGETGDYLLAQAWLGHKTQNMIERYTHIFQAMVRNARRSGAERLKRIRV